MHEDGIRGSGPARHGSTMRKLCMIHRKKGSKSERSMWRWAYGTCRRSAPVCGQGPAPTGQWEPLVHVTIQESSDSGQVLWPAVTRAKGLQCKHRVVDIRVDALWWWRFRGRGRGLCYGNHVFLCEPSPQYSRLGEHTATQATILGLSSALCIGTALPHAQGLLLTRTSPDAVLTASTWLLLQMAAFEG